LVFLVFLFFVFVFFTRFLEYGGTAVCSWSQLEPQLSGDGEEAASSALRPRGDTRLRSSVPEKPAVKAEPPNNNGSEEGESDSE
jgi:hypothetical protein